MALGITAANPLSVSLLPTAATLLQPSLIASTVTPLAQAAPIDATPLASLRGNPTGTTDTSGGLFPASITALLPSPTAALSSTGQLELFDTSALAAPDGLATSTPAGLLGLADYLAVQAQSGNPALAGQAGLSVFV